MPNSYECAGKYILDGKIGVIPTDTVYGLVGLALQPQIVERIYMIKKRSPEMPFIVLIANQADLNQFSTDLTNEQKEFLSSVWPGPVSVIIPITNPDFDYLHRGKNSIAFRVPNNSDLQALLRETGPIVATSANISGQPIVKTIDEAKQLFGSKVDFYCDGGLITNPPSGLVTFTPEGIATLRP